MLTRTHAELDLEDRAATREFFLKHRPDMLSCARAKVGGILANSNFPVDFLHNNLRIQLNVFDAAHEAGVDRMIFLGSSCIYPRDCPQPIKEDYLLTGPLEATNRPYALAKIAGVESCWSLQPPVRHPLSRGHADQYVRPGRQLSSGALPCAARADQALSRGQGQGRAFGCRLGVWQATAGVHVLLRSGRRDPVPDRAPPSNFAELTHPDVTPLINVGVGEDVTIQEVAETGQADSRL